jgi:hypothetical protein
VTIYDWKVRCFERKQHKEFGASEQYGSPLGAFLVLRLVPLFRRLICLKYVAKGY